jgi:hypothetical protein
MIVPIPVAARSKAWVCGRSLAAGHGCLSLVSVVCCQVEVSATGWSLVQRSPTECGVSECDRKLSTMRRPWPTRAVKPLGKKKSVWSYSYQGVPEEYKYFNIFSTRNNGTHYLNVLLFVLKMKTMTKAKLIIFISIEELVFQIRLSTKKFPFITNNNKFVLDWFSEDRIHFQIKAILTTHLLWTGFTI